MKLMWHWILVETKYQEEMWNVIRGLFVQNTKSLYLWYLSPQTCWSLLCITIMNKRNQQQLVFRTPSIQNNCPIDNFFLQLTACFCIIGDKTWTAIKLSMGWGVKSYIIWYPLVLFSIATYGLFVGSMKLMWHWILIETKYQREMWNVIRRLFVQKTKSLYLWYLSPQTCWSLLCTTILNATQKKSTANGFITTPYQ